MVADPIRVAIRVAEILEGLSVPYLVGGSIASSISLGLANLLERALREAGLSEETP